jgi:hypothetical protein
MNLELNPHRYRISLNRGGFTLPRFHCFNNTVIQSQTRGFHNLQVGERSIRHHSGCRKYRSFKFRFPGLLSVRRTWHVITRRSHTLGIRIRRCCCRLGTASPADKAIDKTKIICIAFIGWVPPNQRRISQPMSCGRTLSREITRLSTQLLYRRSIQNLRLLLRDPHPLELLLDAPPKCFHVQFPECWSAESCLGS